jgi:hypothetical protein
LLNALDGRELEVGLFSFAKIPKHSSKLESSIRSFGIEVPGAFEMRTRFSSLSVPREHKTKLVLCIVVRVVQLDRPAKLRFGFGVAGQPAETQSGEVAALELIRPPVFLQMPECLRVLAIGCERAGKPEYGLLVATIEPEYD